MRRPIIWLDGEFVKAEEPLLHSLTPGVLKAQGVFETLRARNGRAVRLKDHLRRMSRGLKVLGIQRPVSFAAIPQNICHVLKANRLKDARVRLMVWQKGGRLYCAITAATLQSPTARKYAQGFKAWLTGGHRRRTRVPIKSLDYRIFRQSLQKARAAGCDEALLLNRKGELIEGSRTNIFLVKDGVLLTPPVTAGCLPGITRQAVLGLARRLKVRCVSRRLKAAELFEADEAFLTSALLGIMPLTRVDSNPVGPGKPGPVTQGLCRALREFSRRLGNSPGA
jgi:branched-chain amino acid aminotransferase